MKKIYSVIKGTGSYIPEKVVKNEDFLNNTFYENYDKPITERDTAEVIQKFYEITGIKERRYVTDGLGNSDIATIAAQRAIETSNIDPETLDYIILGHNYGEAKNGTNVDIVPSIAARVKNKLKIKNPWCVAYDLPFGCPGWVQGLIQADYYIKSGDVKRILVIGSEILSTFMDPYDRDSMIFADGAGAVVLEATESQQPIGIISHVTRTDAGDATFYIYDNHSLNSQKADEYKFTIKMYGRKVYEYALTNVPAVAKMAIDKANLNITDIKKVLIHQANEKMDDAIISRLLKLYGIRQVPENLMPMTIGWLGNSSVATIPTMLDLILKNNFPPHSISKGDHIVLTSVGAGMHINAVVYKF